MEHDKAKAVMEVEGCEVCRGGGTMAAIELGRQRQWRGRPRAVVAREEEESE